MFLGRLRVPSARPPVSSQPRVRVRLISVAAITSGIVAGIAAANGSGPLAGLRVTVPSQLARNHVAHVPMSASVLFPAPKAQVVNRVVPVFLQPATSGTTQSSKTTTEKQTMPAQVKPDDQPRRSPAAQPSPNGGGGGDD